jgi:hypothetical protein
MRALALSLFLLPAFACGGVAPIEEAAPLPPISKSDVAATAIDCGNGGTGGGTGDSRGGPASPDKGCGPNPGGVPKHQD